MSQIKTGARGTAIAMLSAVVASLTCTIDHAVVKPAAISPVIAQPVGEAQPLPMLAHNMDLASRGDVFAVAHPGAKASTWKGFSTVYGPAFAEGTSAVAAAESFRTETMPLFGVDPADVVPGHGALPANANTLGLMYQPDTHTYKFTAIYYSQQRDGVPVYGTALTVLVRNEPGHPVVLAESGLRDLGTFHVPAAAMTRIKANAAYQAAVRDMGAQTNFSPARTVIWAGVGESVVAPALAVEFTGTNGNPVNGLPVEKRYIADAATGAILFSEDLICDVNVSGNVSGMSTPGFGAMACSPPAVQMPLPYARVGIGATFAFADINGNYTIPNAGAGSVQVDSAIRGQYVVVNNVGAGGNTVQSQNVVPPGPANFLYPATDEIRTSEVNVYIATNTVRDLVLAYDPLFPLIAAETGFIANVSVAGTCNAFYSPGNNNINFYLTAGGCNNTGFSNVVHHEYGHRVVAAAGSGQGAYGEGTGDTLGLLISDTSCTGSGFQTCGVCLRDANMPCQYQTTGCSSCGSEIHDCGRLISSCVWSTRNNLLATNPGTYRQILSNLAVNAIKLHTPTSNSSITPAITVHYLTLDDNDANIANGTPHYTEINNGFTAHNMAGPALVLVDFTYPDGKPATVKPDGTTTIRANAIGVAGLPQSGTGVLFADTGAGFQQYAMAESPANNYVATIPASACGTTVRYYFRATIQGGGFATSPSNAPTSFFSATSAYGIITGFDDNFQTNQGWTVTNTPIAGGTFAGAWERGAPITPAATGAPAIDADASGQCYVTANNSSSPDVDWGSTVLTSPIMDASGAGVSLSYNRWFHRNSTTANGDVFRVETSNNGGTNWTTLELLGGTTGAITGSWVAKSFPIVGGTNQFRVRFTINDNATNSTAIEGGVDSVKLQSVICTPPPPPCPADITGNGVVDIDDMVFLITNFNAVGGPADINHDNIVNIDDLVIVVTAFGNCP